MFSLLTMLMAVFFLIPCAHAAPPDGMTIVKKMKEAFEPPHARKCKVEMTLTRNGQTVVKYVAGQATKMFPNGKRSVIVMLGPEMAKGGVYLIEEEKNKPARQWVYIPGVDRVRELVGILDQYHSFFGTDFTYADFGFVHEGGKYTLLGEETHGGEQAYKVEETLPNDNFYFSKIITLISVNSFLPLQRDFYGKDGTLWKTEIFDAVVIDGIPTPVRITMQDLLDNTSSEFTRSRITYDADIPDSLFDPDRLKDAAWHESWKPYREIAK